MPIGALVTPTIAPSYAAGEQRQMTIDDRGSLRVLLNGPTLTPADGGSTEALITARNSSGVQAPLGVMNRYWTGTAQVLARGDTSGAYVIGKGGSTIATTQVTVGTSATLIAAARVGRQKIGVTVTTAVQCAFGNAGVTLATGWPLAPVAYGADSWDTSAALYGVCAATATIGAREQF